MLLFLVAPKLEELSLDGITDKIEVVGTVLKLTCTINRIKPEAAEMYWTINGRRENETMTSEDPDGDGVFKQTITYDYT